MTARGTANLMTQATTFLAIGFFATTVVLARLSHILLLELGLVTVAECALSEAGLQQAP